MSIIWPSNGLPIVSFSVRMRIGASAARPSAAPDGRGARYAGHHAGGATPPTISAYPEALNMSFSRSAADPADTLPDLAATLGRPATARSSRSATRFIRGCRPRRLPRRMSSAFPTKSRNCSTCRRRSPRSPASPSCSPATRHDWPAHAMPYAAVYSGHQFGVWAGQLGDGRALTIGERTGTDGRRYELQLKGSGRTPYFREWATAARCCARRSANSCARKRCITSASRPRAH